MYFRIFVLLVCFFFTVPGVFASTYVPVEDGTVYDLLNRLEAEGVITSGLLNTKPISRKEAARLLEEAESNSATGSLYVQSMVRLLKDRLMPDQSGGTQLRPLDSVYGKYIYTNSPLLSLKYNTAAENEQPMNYNNNGDLYNRGTNARFGFFSRIDDLGPLSAEINPEFRYPETPFTEEKLVTKKAYGVLDLSGWDIIIGQDSQWWGPGYHGALLLSDNAEPFTVLKLTNPSPVRLPWIFDSLGPFGLTLFVANPADVGVISRPYFYGMRFELKPHPLFEIAFEKTALIGGRGRQLNYSDWVNSMLPFSDAENRPDQEGGDPGDQRAGIDFKITIPWNVQPMQIYLEAAGEDEKHNLPNIWAFVGGIYFPRILNAEQIDLRLEWARTQGRTLTPYVWYTHHLYGSYTYNGNVIGHHIGTDSNDIFTQVSYLIPESNTRLSLSYDRELHNLIVDRSSETLHQLTVAISASVTSRVDMSASYSMGWLRNKGNLPASTETLGLIETALTYRF